jgi:tRNA threonylcarbamoyladenosine biosynthesis protein TsaE
MPLVASDRVVTREALIAWGVAFGREVRAPLTVAVSGDLGTGKTTLIQAICRGLDVTEQVTSPTFALVHQYDTGRLRVYHLDLYRLKDESELTNIGWHEILGDRAVVLVEWPERAGDRLPSDTVRVTLAHRPTEPDRRSLFVS